MPARDKNMKNRPYSGTRAGALLLSSLPPF